MRFSYKSFLLPISFTPFLWLFTKIDVFESPIIAFANISGFLGTLIFFWQFLYDKTNTKESDYKSEKIHPSHNIYGLIGIFLAIAHPLLILIQNNKTIQYIFSLNLSSQLERYISLGRVTLIVYILISITRLLLKSELTKKHKKYLYNLTYPLMFFIFFHASKIGTSIQSLPIIHTYWMILSIIFFLLVIHRSLQTFKVSIFSKKSFA